MWETIATWGGVAGLFVSVFAVIILFLTRKNILDILDKDVILFDKNFELKNKAIQNAFTIVDEIEKNSSVINSSEFIERAKICYNELLCVLTDVRIADEFYNIAVDNSIEATETQIAQFKLSCRHDIGLKTKKAKTVKRLVERSKNSTEPLNSYQTSSMDYNRPVSNFGGQPINTQTIQSQPVKPTPPAQPRPISRSTQPVQSSQSPARPISRPTATQQTIKRPAKPSSEDDKI